MRGDHAETVGERVSDAAIVVAHPDDLVSHVVGLMVAADQGRVPITDAETGVLVGLVTRQHLLQVRAAVTRSEADRRAYLPRPSLRRARPPRRPARARAADF